MKNKRLSTLCIAVASITMFTACDNANDKQHNNATAAPVAKTTNISTATVNLKPVTQQVIDDIADTLTVSYRLVTNLPSDKCDAKISDGACFTVELAFTAKNAINSNDWQIFFSQISPIQSFESDEFSVEHINGDLHKISLNDNFKGFKSGETKTLTFSANFWMLSETDALPNYILAATNSQLEPKVITSTQATIDAETGLEQLPFIVPFTDVNQQFKRTVNDKTQWLNSQSLYQRNLALRANIDVNTAIIPTPKSVIVNANNEQVNIEKGLRYNLINSSSSDSNKNSATAELALEDINAAISHLSELGLRPNEAGVPVNLSVKSNDKLMIGSYQLDVTPKGINIEGVDANGVYNGLQSLASLYTVGAKTLPVLSVIDEPHYNFRGMLLDVARNFHSKEVVIKLIEQMGAYKLNKLHLHLGDDEGWRLEIPSLPELTEVGGQRCFDSQEQTCLIPQLGAGVDKNSLVNGYYSVSDYQEILRAANANHVQVIPSLDMPGHSRSSIKAMQARYNKYKALEDDEKATEFLLNDFDDTTKYSSVQYYNDNTINVCMESSYAFVKEVMTQVKAIHQQADHPLTRYHIGADETAGAWIESPVCKEFVANNDYGITDISQVGPYFIERVAGILSDLDIETAGWSDGMSHTQTQNMPAIVQANAWDVLFWGGHSKVHELANRNWQVVLSTPDVLYFDFPYEADPKEHGYYWASRHINTEKIFQFIPDNLPIHAEFWLDREDNPYSADDTLQKDASGKVISAPLAKNKQFLGIQGQLWSENTRNDNMVEHKIFPRLLALAERAWYLPEWAVPYNYQGAKYSRDTQVFTDENKRQRDSSWNKFANTLGKKELKKLELTAIDYRLPTVGAIVKDNTLYANIAFPGIAIEYQLDDGPWQTYVEPVTVNNGADDKMQDAIEYEKIKVRSKSFDQKRTGRITQVHFK